MNDKTEGRSTPGEKLKRGEAPDLTPLELGLITFYRSLTMRANFMVEDRYDCKFAAKELARDMKTPTKFSFEKLKRLPQYLIWQPRCPLRMHWQSKQSRLLASSDSNWAGYLVRRRSTTAVMN